MDVQKIPLRGQTVGEEVVAAKSRRKDMAVAAAVAAVLAAVFVAFCVLTAVLAEEARAVGAVIWGAGAVAMAVLAVMYGKKARRIAALPQGIIVFTGEKLRICAKGGLRNSARKTSCASKKSRCTAATRPSTGAICCSPAKTGAC